MKLRYLPLLLLTAFGVALAADLGYPLDAPAPDGRRPGGTLTQEFQAPHIAPEENKDMRRERNYPEQPPTTPHAIAGYQVDKFGNRCLTCHSRANSERSQAPMISITHYMDRDGQPLAAMSPRRYFCTQCHVTQAEVKPLVENGFQNIDQLLLKEANPAGHR